MDGLFPLMIPYYLIDHEVKGAPKSKEESNDTATYITFIE